MSRNPNWTRGLGWELLTPDTAGPYTSTGNAGSYVTMVNYTIPGRLPGPTGLIKISPLWTTTTVNTNGKQLRIQFGGSDVFLPASSAMSGLGALRPSPIIIQNLTESSQVCAPKTTTGTTSTNGLATLSIDTTADQVLAFAVNLAVGTDDIRLLPLVEILRG